MGSSRGTELEGERGTAQTREELLIQKIYRNVTYILCQGSSFQHLGLGSNNMVMDLLIRHIEFLGTCLIGHGSGTLIAESAVVVRERGG